MLKRMIKLLHEAKSEINKSEVRTIEAIEKALKLLEEMREKPCDNQALAVALLLVLHDLLQHLPSLAALIHSLYSQ